MLKEDLIESPSLVLSYLVRRDLPDLLEIERQSFRQCWNEDQFIECMQSQKTSGVFASSGKVGCGFALYELHKGFLVILNLAVLPDCRRMGIATQMIDRLKKFSKHIKISVSEWHVDGQLFLKSQGFNCTQSIEVKQDEEIEMAYLFEWAKH